MGNISYCPCLRWIRRRIKKKSHLAFDVYEQSFTTQEGNNSQNIKKESNSELMVQKQAPRHQSGNLIQDKENSLSSHIMQPARPKRKVDLQNFRFCNRTSEFLIKCINTLQMQQFNIEDCKDCQIYIFDTTGNVYIDDTTNCTIYVAPCEGSIFIRNCQNLKFVGATKQFRTYNSHNCTFSLYCKSQPVIESSSSLVFASFEGRYYEELQEQFRKTNLQIWNNHWSQIYNFTKKEGETHYTLSRHAGLEGNLEWEKALQMANIRIVEDREVIPFIRGNLQLEEEPSGGECILQIENYNDKMNVKHKVGHLLIIKAFQENQKSKNKKLYLLLKYNEVNDLNELYSEGEVHTQTEDVVKYKDKIFVNFDNV